MKMLRAASPGNSGLICRSEVAQTASCKSESEITLGKIRIHHRIQKVQHVFDIENTNERIWDDEETTFWNAKTTPVSTPEPMQSVSSTSLNKLGEPLPSALVKDPSTKGTKNNRVVFKDPDN